MGRFRVPVFITVAASVVVPMVIIATRSTVRLTGRSIWVGRRPATLFIASNLVGREVRAMVVSPELTLNPGFHAPSGGKASRRGMFQNGNFVRRWDRPYVVLLGVDSDGRTLMHDVPCNERRLLWLYSHDPASDEDEIDRLAADCRDIEMAAEGGRRVARAVSDQ